MANPKEIVEKALQKEATPYIPVGLFLGGSWPVIKAGMSLEALIGNASKTAEVFYEANKRLGADLIMIGAGATALIIKALGGEVRFNSKGAPEIMNHIIQDEADLDRLKTVDVTKDPGFKWLIETGKNISLYNQDERMVLASGRAPFTLAAQMYGLEKTMKALYRKKEFIHRVLEFATEISIAYFKAMIEEGLVHGAFIADPTASGDVVSVKHFEEFVLPYQTKVVMAVKSLKKPSVLHICGDISDRLHLVAKTGIDCLSIDTKVDLAKAKEKIGKNICLAGNVCPVDILQFGSRNKVRESTLACMEKGAAEGGFILLPGCDLAGDVSEENIRAFVETGHQWNGLS
ncbi:MAG: uroporphyrinogen decarboxylase family protein [Clostridia bacterium]|nr:uroporphyrinogen decarboxylase family protein [Clostridia bacterium]